MLGYERCGCCNRWIDMPNEDHFHCHSCCETVCKDCVPRLVGDDRLEECPRCVRENAEAEVQS